MSLQFYKLIKQQVLTSKVSELTKGIHCYAFVVSNEVNKILVKKAIEFLFKVKVKFVNILIVKKHSVVKNKFGRIRKKVQKWKKAFVFLEKGFSIDFLKLE